MAAMKPHDFAKPFRITEAVIDALDGLDLSFPKVDAEKLQDLKKARAALQSEK